MLGLLFAASVTAVRLHWNGNLLLAVFTASYLWILFLLLAIPLYGFPRGVRTFEQLTRAVVARNHHKLAMEAGGSTQEQAWRAFRELAGDATGIESAKIKRLMRFSEDLRIY